MVAHYTSMLAILSILSLSKDEGCGRLSTACFDKLSMLTLCRVAGCKHD